MKKFKKKLITVTKINGCSLNDEQWKQYCKCFDEHGALIPQKKEKLRAIVEQAHNELNEDRQGDEPEICPICGNAISFDNVRYCATRYTSAVCERCRKRLFSIGRILCEETNSTKRDIKYGFGKCAVCDNEETYIRRQRTCWKCLKILKNHPKAKTIEEKREIVRQATQPRPISENIFCEAEWENGV